MLKLYYGRESLDKDRFLFDRVAEALEQLNHGGSEEPGSGELGCDITDRTNPGSVEPGDARADGTKPGSAKHGDARAGSSASGKILLVVPDQFTLQAEQNAFEYLDIEGMMDLEILSQSRLGFRVLEETGGSTRLHIDKYGRHMVIAGIVERMGGKLSAYGGVKASQSFIEMTNDFITEMKQNGVAPEQLEEILEQIEADSLLHRKLSDIGKIYEKYEEELEGKYIDTEDYMELFTSKIPQSSIVKGSQIWIYGFDSFTKKSVEMIRALMVTAADVNIVMSGDRGNSADSDLFELTDRILWRLSKAAEECGVLWDKQAIPDSYEIPVKDISEGEGSANENEASAVSPAEMGTADTNKKSAEMSTAVMNKKSAEMSASAGVAADSRFRTPELAHLERELYAYPHREYRRKDPERGDKSTDSPASAGTTASPRSIRFCRAANLYAEVETAAARIVELTRDKGLQYNEIALICNDLGKYGSVLKRVFELYDIPVFLDEKRTILHDPAVELVMSLLDIVTKGWQTQDVFRFLKTGLFPLKPEQYEELENYAIKYRIRGKKWKSDFIYGLQEYGEEGLKELNGLRKLLSEPILSFEAAFKESKSARSRSIALYRMLEEILELPDRLEQLLERLNEREEYLEAEEISQIWGVIVKLLDQMVELLGDETISGEDYASMLQSGMAAVEIGLLPPTLDQIIAGTMQRTRRGRIRALLVIGANDGLIPADSGKEDLLSETEKEYLEEQDIVLCKNDDYRACEERLAIYKNLSKPEQYLWVSYSVADLDGREKKPSLIFDKLREIFPESPVEKDVINQTADLERIQRCKAAMTHMSEAFRRKLSGDTQEVTPVWKAAYNYLREEDEQSVAALKRGLFFTNKVGRLDEAVVRRIYKQEGMEDFIVSPSRMERFGKCPFSHFVQYGLKPEERRIFEVAGREVGDVYHQCLMELSQALTLREIPVTGEGSPWMTISRQECEERVGLLIDRIAGEYREGVLKQGGQEEYRSGRMKKIAESAAWAMISHVRQGLIKEVYFEAGFGEGNDRPFPPIVIEAAGQRVRIEGKIDRVDVLAGSSGAAAAQSGNLDRSDSEAVSGDGEGLEAGPDSANTGAMAGADEGLKAGTGVGQSSVPGLNAADFGAAAGSGAANSDSDQNYIKIVDYKSGSERFDMEEAREGIRLQLMLYLEGAMGGVRQSKPAGVFYFEIAEPMVNASEFPVEELESKVADQVKKSFKMDGIMVDDPAVIAGIAGEFSGFSDIVPVRKGSKGISGTSDGKVLDPETFEQFRSEVSETIGNLCVGLVTGDVGIHPKKTKYQNACRFCQFKGICFFDLSFEGCQYR